MWRSTVFGDRNNCAAMSFVEWADASRSSTSTSRAVAPALLARNLVFPFALVTTLFNRRHTIEIEGDVSHRDAMTAVNEANIALTTLVMTATSSSKVAISSMRARRLEAAMSKVFR